MFRRKFGEHVTSFKNLIGVQTFICCVYRVIYVLKFESKIFRDFD